MCKSIGQTLIMNKNAFQLDAYHPLVARISPHALLRGGLLRGGGYAPGGGLLWGRGIPACLEADPSEQNQRQV